MNTYLVCYDLKQPRTDSQYQQLHLAIMGLGTAKHLQYSVWVVESAKTEVEIRNELRSYVDWNDNFFVAKFNAYASWGVSKDTLNTINNAWNRTPWLDALLAAK